MNTKPRLSKLPIYLGVCFAVFVFGGLFQPGEWYTTLNRAPWNPPGIAFPIVWSILYVLIAISGWRLFATDHTLLKQLWIVQLMLNAAWSYLFFGLHSPLLALIDILLLTFCVLVLIIQAWRLGLRPSSCLLMPYALWLLLASSLNAYIVVFNEQRKIKSTLSQQ